MSVCLGPGQGQLSGQAYYDERREALEADKHEKEITALNRQDGRGEVKKNGGTHKYDNNDSLVRWLCWDGLDDVSSLKWEDPFSNALMLL